MNNDSSELKILPPRYDLKRILVDENITEIKWGKDEILIPSESKITKVIIQGCFYLEKVQLNKYVKILDISGCNSLSTIITNKHMEEIYVNSVPRLHQFSNLEECNKIKLGFDAFTNIDGVKVNELILNFGQMVPNVKNLITLRLSNGDDIPEIPTLERLEICSCRITKLPQFPNLKSLEITDSKIRTIPDINYEYLYLIFCNNLIIPKHQINKHKIYIHSCRWIDKQNEQKIIKIQRIYSKNRSVYLMMKYKKTKEFLEWYYNPNNVGGKRTKQQLQNITRRN
tara:strand:- start:1237 stop:2088 length:852 start_codon:yes stop_codon:yes gene_type:complete